MCLWVYIHCVWVGAQGGPGPSDTLEAGVIGSSELPDGCAGNWTCLLNKSFLSSLWLAIFWSSAGDRTQVWLMVGTCCTAEPHSWPNEDLQIEYIALDLGVEDNSGLWSMWTFGTVGATPCNCMCVMCCCLCSVLFWEASILSEEPWLPIQITKIKLSSYASRQKKSNLYHF